MDQVLEEGELELDYSPHVPQRELAITWFNKSVPGIESFPQTRGSSLGPVNSRKPSGGPLKSVRGG